jgi:hypothetical protein
MAKNTLLKFFSGITILTGLFFVLSATLFPELSKAIFLFSPEYDSSDVNEAGMDLVKALSAIFGAVIIGWGITIYYISDNFTPDSRKILTIALSLWFVLDSLGSLLNNLEYNVILNLSFLCAGLVALYYTPKSADKE